MPLKKDEKEKKEKSIQSYLKSRSFLHALSMFYLFFVTRDTIYIFSLIWFLMSVLKN